MTDAHDPQPSDSPAPPSNSPPNSLPDDAGRIDAIAEEFLSALQAGGRPDRAALTAANPRLAPALDDRLKLVELVYRAASRPAHRPPPWQREEAKRFCCPHCGNQIQLVETAGHEITCENCGSSFHVTEPSTLSYQPAEGSRSIGRFELREPLGRGAFGFVYKAFDPELRRFVAIKVPRAGYFPTPEDEERFLREARAAARLAHPGIVRVHEISRHSGLPYLVSDYIEGVTLADRLSSGRLGFREAAELVAELADAAEYAHRHHVVHRDLKPSNVLLDSRGRPAITDFGLARNAEAEITVTLDGQVLGTPAYMSPEQARGEANRVDARSDIYSLGVILYELLTGELPFRGNRRMLLHQVLEDEPRPPRRTNDRIPRDLETICLKAMAKSPARRYASAADLADDLRRWLDRKPVRARPVGAVERGWSWCRRNPLPAALAAAVALALLTGTIVSLHFADRAVAKAADEARERHRADGKAADAAAEARRADAKAAEARRNLYISDMHLAEQYWADGQTGPAIELLDRYLPKPGEEDLRGWEWYYQQRLCHQELRTLSGHSHPVYAVIFSPDDTRLATAGADGVKMWDVATGAQLRSFCNELGNCLAFNAEGTLLAAGCNEKVGRPRVLNTVNGVERSMAPADTSDAFASLSIRFAGASLFESSHDGVSVWNPETVDKVSSFVTRDEHDDCVRSSFTPDGSVLVTASLKGKIASWDVSSGLQLRELATEQLVSCLSISADGKMVVTCVPGEHFVIYDISTGDRVATLPCTSHDVSCLSFSPDRRRFALGTGRGAIELLDVSSGLRLRRFSGHGAPVRCVAFNSLGDRLASADSSGAVRIWDMSAAFGKPLTRIARRDVEHSGRDPGRAVRLGTLIEQPRDVAAGEEALALQGRFPSDEAQLDPYRLVCDRAYTLFCWGIIGGFYDVSFSHDGQSIAALSLDSRNALTVWDASSGCELRTVEPPSGGGWIDMAFTGGATCLGVRKRGSNVTLVNLQDGSERQLFTCSDIDRRVKAVLSGEGGWLAYTDNRRRTSLLEVSSGKEFVVSSKWCRGYRWIEGDSLLMGLFAENFNEAEDDWDDLVRLWSAADGRERFISGKLPVHVDEFDIRSDAHLLAACSYDEISLIDLSTTRRLHVLRGHSGKVWCVAFNPSGTRLASAGEDMTVKLWDVATGQEVRTLTGHSAPVLRVAFSDDGRRLATASNDQSVRVYDAHEFSTELAQEREARGVAELQLYSVRSLTDLIQCIEARRDITEAVRLRALALAPTYWRSEVRAAADEAVRAAFKKLLLKADVVASLRQNATLDDDVRTEAIRQAEKHHDDAGGLNAASWDVVTRRDADAADYSRALRWAEAACKLEPDDGNDLNTLGLAQYRVGQFEAALATLTRSTELNTKDGTPHPSDLAFLALVHQGLGHAEEAQTLLQRLRELAREPSWQADAETQAFLLEAEERIAPAADPAN